MIECAPVIVGMRVLSKAFYCDPRGSRSLGHGDHGEHGGLATKIHEDHKGKATDISVPRRGSKRGARERVEHGRLRWWIQDVCVGKLLSSWELRSADLRGGGFQIVRRVPQFDVGSEQQPIGTGLPKR